MYKLKLSHENNERDSFVCLFNWLDTKLEITEDKSNCIDKERLEKHIVFNYFEFFEYQIFNSKNVCSFGWFCVCSFGWFYYCSFGWFCGATSFKK